ncbi:hypothetical protein [Blastococcus atacamensis]|uniref:hypothetical protein n=1 Tax=Blastococcus atacamensis TaxID=2070508 RepID=UPI000CECC1C8|nr:hypothetical protein [Blastococcus atacamensis]
MLWDIGETIWEWATDNRRRAIRFFSTVGVVIVAAGVAVLVISTRPVAPDSLCASVSELETDLAVSFGSSTNNAVFDGLAEVAGDSERLADDAPGEVGSVHASAAGLQSLADRDSISMAEVMTALQPVQSYCANLTTASQADAAVVPPVENYVQAEDPPAAVRPTTPPTRPATPVSYPILPLPSYRLL